MLIQRYPHRYQGHPVMPIWVNLYLAIILLSLPMGVMMLRRIEQDWLHPVGGVVSTLLSAAFVVAYWQPEAVPFQSTSVLLLFGFVIFWDGYSLQRMKKKLPEYLQVEDQPELQPGNGAWLLGIIMMVPAYFFGAMVCMRALG